MDAAEGQKFRAQISAGLFLPQKARVFQKPQNAFPCCGNEEHRRGDEKNWEGDILAKPRKLKLRSCGGMTLQSKTPKTPNEFAPLKVLINHWLKPVARMAFEWAGVGSICCEQDYAHPAINWQSYPVDIIGASGEEDGRLPQILVNSQTVRRRRVQEALKPFRFPL